MPRKFEMCLKKGKNGIDRENNLNLSWKEQRSSLEIVRSETKKLNKVQLICKTSIIKLLMRTHSFERKNDGMKGVKK